MTWPLDRWAMWLEGQLSNRPGRRVSLPAAAIGELIRDLRAVECSTTTEQKTES